jgi:hypothetical protein
MNALERKMFPVVLQASKRETENSAVVQGRTTSSATLCVIVVPES